ncbi:MAG TPA: hypothetical protein DIU39_01185 [Flavobacteriales bacterium]|nr:hypothetical protein [Flavobacteriales bacterium]
MTIFTTSCYYDNEQELYPIDPNASCDTLNVTYSGTISIILEAQCNGCHSGTIPAGGIKTDNYTDVKALVDNGKLMGVIKHEPGYSPMPKGGQKLSDCDISKFEVWIRNGALNN